MMLAAPAFAEPSAALDRVSISAGAYRSDPSFKASYDTRYGKLDSGDIDGRQTTMPRFKADLLIFDSQGLSFDYFRYKRAYGRSVSVTREIAGEPLSLNADASVDTKIEFGKLAWKWWFGDQRTVFGLGAGAAYYRLSVSASANAALNDASASVSGSYSEDALAPLLELGARHAITPDLRLYAEASGVRKAGGHITGNIYNAALGAEWFPLKNLGVGVDYGLTNINLHRDGSDDARLKIRLKGPSAFVKLRF